MTPACAIAVSSIWLGVGLAGFATQSQPLIAITALFAMFATGIVVKGDEQ